MFWVDSRDYNTHFCWSFDSFNIFYNKEKEENGLKHLTETSLVIPECDMSKDENVEGRLKKSECSNISLLKL